MSYTSEYIGDRIKKACKEKGWTQEKLAKAVGLSPKGLNDIITNKSDPKLSNIIQIAHWLDIDDGITWLITGYTLEELLYEKKSRNINRMVVKDTNLEYDTDDTIQLVTKLLKLNTDHRNKIVEIIEGYLKLEGQE